MVIWPTIAGFAHARLASRSGDATGAMQKLSFRLEASKASLTLLVEVARDFGSYPRIMD